MSLESVRSPDVADHCSGIPVAGLMHDPREIGASLGRRRDVAGPQTVRPEQRGIEAGGRAVGLDDVGDGAIREAGELRAIPPHST